jgi:hypothetical protein
VNRRFDEQTFVDHVVPVSPGEGIFLKQGMQGTYGNVGNVLFNKLLFKNQERQGEGWKALTM